VIEWVLEKSKKKNTKIKEVLKREILIKRDSEEMRGGRRRLGENLS
jgi:hypothetical protein